MTTIICLQYLISGDRIPNAVYFRNSGCCRFWMLSHPTKVDRRSNINTFGIWLWTSGEERSAELVLSLAGWLRGRLW